MANTKVFIGNINQSVRKSELRSEFEKYGPVIDVYISSGYGFITFENGDDALSAIRSMDGVTYRGEKLRVEMSRSRANPSDRGRARGNHHHHSRRSPPPPRSDYRDYSSSYDGDHHNRYYDDYSRNDSGSRRGRDSSSQRSRRNEDDRHSSPPPPPPSSSSRSRDHYYQRSPPPRSRSPIRYRTVDSRQYISSSPRYSERSYSENSRGRTEYSRGRVERNSDYRRTEDRRRYDGGFMTGGNMERIESKRSRGRGGFHRERSPY